MTDVWYAHLPGPKWHWHGAAALPSIDLSSSGQMAVYKWAKREERIAQQVLSTEICERQPLLRKRSKDQ